VWNHPRPGLLERNDYFDDTYWQQWTNSKYKGYCTDVLLFPVNSPMEFLIEETV